MVCDPIPQSSKNMSSASNLPAALISYTSCMLSIPTPLAIDSKLVKRNECIVMLKNIVVHHLLWIFKTIDPLPMRICYLVYKLLYKLVINDYDYYLQVLNVWGGKLLILEIFLTPQSLITLPTITTKHLLVLFNIRPY